MKNTESVDVALEGVARAYLKEPAAVVKELDVPVVPLPTAPPAVEQRYRLAAVRLTSVLEARGAREPRALGRLLVVTSPERRDGKTTTALHLASALAHGLGKRVALVEADRARPGLAALLGRASARGLADVISGACGLDEALVRGEEGGPLLLPGGEPNGHPPSPGALMATLNALREYHDLVLVDCPALATAADAAVLGRTADGVLVVVRAGATTAPALSSTLEALIDTTLLGTIVNDLDGPAITRLPRPTIARNVGLDDLEDD